MKGKYTDKRSGFQTSIEDRFTLSVISQFENPGWQDELHESLNISSFPAERSKVLSDPESELSKNTKRKQEPEKRKRNEARNPSRVRTVLDRKREGTNLFTK
jgi:hypothetical protein